VNRDELKNLIQSLLDGQITQPELESLERELETSEPARQLYVEFSELHSLLDQRATASPVAQNVVPIDRIIRRQKRRTMKIAAFAAAAVVVLGLVAMQLFFVKDRPPTLAFVTSLGTQFELTHSRSNDGLEGAVLEDGSHLTLSQGAVELTFASGVKAIVMAPADLTLHDDDTLFLNQGTAWFQVPKGAEGFTVKTRDLEIVDLGTEFGVIAKPNDHDEVHVTKGKVQVTTSRVRKESTTLTASEARRIDPVGRLDTIPAIPSLFLTSLPKSLPYLHWSFDEVEGGGFPAVGQHPDLEHAFAMPRKAQASSMQCSGRFGKAVHFTGKPGEEILTEWPGISGNAARTIACWIRISPESLSSYGSSIAAWGKKREGYQGWHTKWKLAISPEGKPIVVGGIAGSSNVADNQWHHIACTHKMSTQGAPIVTMFVDGHQVENIWQPHTRSKTADLQTIATPNTTTTDQSSLPLQIGKNLGNTTPIRGEIDELYIFEGALDAETIHRLATDNQHQP